MIEMLGAERLVYGKLGSALFTVRIAGTDPVPSLGQTVPVQVTAEHLHWFDEQTKARVS
jgi:sn-glycerol 3-phosphate transport system ATP-binding protein